MSLAIVASLSRSLGHRINAPLTGWSLLENPLSNLVKRMDSRPLPPSVKDYGDMMKFTSEAKEYEITQLNPFNSFLFGPNYGYKKALIEDSMPRLTQKRKEADDNLKFLWDKGTKTYTLTRENFRKTRVKDKGNLSLAMDLELKLKNGETIPMLSSIGLSDLQFEKWKTVALFSIKESQKNDESIYSVKFEREILDESLRISIVKDNGLSGIVEVSIRDFYVIFSNDPPVSFEGLFSDRPEQVNDVLWAPSPNSKRMFLDRWTKKNGKDSPETTFDFETKDGFWSSSCLDPYRIGGFIDDSPAPKPAAKSQSKTSSQKFIPYRKQQEESYEDVSPFSSTDRAFAFEPYTIPTPCSGLEQKTKTTLSNYAKPEASGKPKQNLPDGTHIDWSLMPQPIRESIEGTKGKPSPKHKIIQGSLKKKEKGGLFVSSFEDSNLSTHVFEAKIEKNKLIKKILEHEKLSTLRDVSEISNQLQVYLPYSLTVYDPVNNYLKNQRINVNVFLDLKSIYNQSQFEKEFLTYDIASANNKVQLGLSGKVNFKVGLFLDIDGNLRIRFTVQTSGFFKEVSTEGDCDPRSRKTGDKCDQSKHIPPFIVLQITEDPTISTFYIDRRIRGELKSPKRDGSDATNIKEFKERLEKGVDVSFTHQLDKSNNAEVFFDRIDLADPVAQKNTKVVGMKDDGSFPNEYQFDFTTFSYHYFLASYYVPRRNYGEISVMDHQNLDEIDFYVTGSSNLGGRFFLSMHYGTLITYCSATVSTDKLQKSTDNDYNGCADGKQYEKIEKDRDSNEINRETYKNLKIKFSDLKTSNQNNPKVFDFQTIINRPFGDAYKFDSTKLTLQFILKPENGFCYEKTGKEGMPEFSFVTVWYRVKMWWDNSKKKICYRTELVPISAIGDLQSSMPKGIAVAESDKWPGSAARAGFQMSKVEFKYKKGAN